MHIEEYVIIVCEFGSRMHRNGLTFPNDSFLGRLSNDSWNLLSSLWKVTEYKSGQFLISADDDVGDVFFVLRGSAKATIFTDSGREVNFVSIHIGDCFGEFSAIDLSPRSASVIATEDCLVGRLSSGIYRNLCQNNPDIAFNAMIVLVGHLRKLSRRVVDFNSKSSNKRLQEALLALAESKSGGNDEVVIDTPPTQNELAATIFASRESVAREMGRMRKLGVLGRKRRSLHVPSLAALREFVESDPG